MIVSKVLYFVLEQPWNAFEDSGVRLPVDVNSQGLQLHSFPPADNHISGLSASEVGKCFLYYHSSLPK